MNEIDESENADYDTVQTEVVVVEYMSIRIKEKCMGQTGFT